MDVLIIGGGLGGLTAALDLRRRGHAVLLVERKRYPFHKVCGEYVSNEVLPYLRRLGADPAALAPAAISRFLLSSPAGRTLTAPLDLGGFGISRYSLDYFLYQQASALGVVFEQQATVTDVVFDEASGRHRVTLADGRSFLARAVLGAYGKRANLDRQLQRPFFQRRSPYLGVKYHLRLPGFPQDLIALHNFADGYAGISAIEADQYCFCYLTTRLNLKAHGTIPQLEAQVLARNPHLRDILHQAEFLYPQPEVINEISFAPKSCVENHVLMCGDAAGLITPLCGNGMAMAIRGAEIAARHLHEFLHGRSSRPQLEAAYRREWQHTFGQRLRVGRAVQGLFGRPILSEAAVSGLRFLPGVVRGLMRQTHGPVF
ncbi:Dehydrogenase (flavoprotein) [Hymenobacter daecheongensis DSM 21074]|uniref:Dehydrogenase (Flavoprotein) n=1 Tax=Hymenobacter daecheongensis DSM 21074 TaxID=1121955 RepID=A0A1M6L508_9BACT|nr:FAD-dependent oxidoreductase [Hymenobacter daecheongensis]SHJ66204.1 Dehydrogenase (flavoprotein) [Hymenobacter daecheongensis DSM 21074]